MFTFQNMYCFAMICFLLYYLYFIVVTQAWYWVFFSDSLNMTVVSMNFISQ